MNGVIFTLQSLFCAVSAYLLLTTGEPTYVIPVVISGLGAVYLSMEMSKN